jgi:hypothetical protein
MSLTHDFKETIRPRAQRDRKFRQALLLEAVNPSSTAILRLARQCSVIT